MYILKQTPEDFQVQEISNIKPKQQGKYFYYNLKKTNRNTLDVIKELAKRANLKEKQIGVINASPLSMGLLSRRGTPAWHPATAEIKAVCAKAAQYCTDKGVHIEKLAVQFSIQHPDIPTTLVGTANPENITRNIDWIEEPIDEELLQGVQEILKPIQNKTWPSGRPGNN